MKELGGCLVLAGEALAGAVKSVTQGYILTSVGSNQTGTFRLAVMKIFLF